MKKIESTLGYWQFGTISPGKKYTILMANWAWKKKKKTVLYIHTLTYILHGAESFLRS